MVLTVLQLLHTDMLERVYQTMISTYQLTPSFWCSKAFNVVCFWKLVIQQIHTTHPGALKLVFIYSLQCDCKQTEHVHELLMPLFLFSVICFKLALLAAGHPENECVVSFLRLCYMNVLCYVLGSAI